MAVQRRDMAMGNYHYLLNVNYDDNDDDYSVDADVTVAVENDSVGNAAVLTDDVGD